MTNIFFKYAEHVCGAYSAQLTADEPCRQRNGDVNRVCSHHHTELDAAMMAANRLRLYNVTRAHRGL